MTKPHPQNDDAPVKSSAAGNNLFCCDVCGKAFKSFNYRQTHKNGVHGEKRYDCSVDDCGYSTSRNGDLQQHMRKHSGEKPFACDVSDCGYTTKWQRVLQSHKRTHSGEKPFVCDVSDCGKAFARRIYLKSHTRNVHEMSRPFLCQRCSYSCSNACDLSKHAKAVHDKVKDWRCEICHKQFALKSHLTDHIARIHEKQSRFRCDQCGKCFYLRTEMERHARTHLERVKFKCDKCERQFLYKRTLTLHVNSIHGNAPRPKNLRCKMCNYATFDKTKLDLHVRARHEKERPFHCIECSQSFAWKLGLQRHLQLHGTRIYKCAQCDRQYRRQHSLLTHAAIHGQKLQCAFCKFATHYMNNLKIHVLGQHKDELRQTIVAAHSDAPCCTPEGEVTASKGIIWDKYEQAQGIIGQGDFGNVSMAKLRSTQEIVHGYRYAIKCVDLTTIELKPEAHLRKCQREVQLMHDCRHENVISIYEFFEFYKKEKPNKFYMVMELGSESLTFVKDNNDLSEKQCSFIFAKIAAALKHVHSLGVVHRDAKPDNVMICFDGVPKLCDFGESAHLREDGTCIGPRGSPMYGAPEMGTDAEPKAYGPKVDVFSFGISAAEVTARGEYNLIRTNQTNTLKAIRARVSRMSAAYQDLVMACVAFDPSKRPSSSEVYDCLEKSRLAQGLDASCLDNIVANFIH